MPKLPSVRALAAIVVAGAALRFVTLDAQSYWLDEAATVDLLRRGFGDMLDGVADGESTPPLYYVVAWLWAKLAGTGEVGLRSLSALLGTGTIVVGYGLGRYAAGARAGLIAAAICAANPFLVWYSQEARAYALLVLLTAGALLALVHGRRWAWALLSVAALATHWFALFPVAAMAVWLLTREARRAAAAPVAAVAATGAALLPLALSQRSHDRAGFIDESSLARRLAEVPKQFLAGYDAPAEAVVTLLFLGLAACAAVAALRVPREARGRVAALAGGGAVVIAIPAVLAVGGADHLIARNVLPAWLPLIAAGAAGLAYARWGAPVAAALCVLGAGVTIAVAVEPRYQRDNWRGAAEAIPLQERDRVVVVTPPSGELPLRIYLPRSRRPPEGGSPVSEYVIVALPAQGPGRSGRPPQPPSSPPPAPVFGELARIYTDTYSVLLYRADSAIHVFPTILSPLDGSAARVLFQPLR